ncbi:MAG: hypothetical protein GY856_55450, partial [bacterium]|nr:hypothetical protein [bacterium]
MDGETVEELLGDTFIGGFAHGAQEFISLGMHTIEDIPGLAELSFVFQASEGEIKVPSATALILVDADCGGPDEPWCDTTLAYKCQSGLQACWYDDSHGLCSECCGDLTFSCGSGCYSPCDPNDPTCDPDVALCDPGDALCDQDCGRTFPGPNPTPDVDFLFYGDFQTALCLPEDFPGQMMVAKKIAEITPGFIIHGGDLIQDYGVAGNDCQTNLGYRNPERTTVDDFQILSTLSQPVINNIGGTDHYFSARGNHDVRLLPCEEGEEGMCEEVDQIIVRDSVRDVYEASVLRDGIFFLFFDTSKMTGPSISEEQIDDIELMLESEEAQTADFIIAVTHRPGIVNEYAEIHDLFRRYGVELMLSGHFHRYEYHESEGIIYVTSGGGGAAYSRPAGAFPEDLHFIEFRRVAGSLELSATVRNVIDGSVRDSFSVTPRAPISDTDFIQNALAEPGDEVALRQESTYLLDEFIELTADYQKIYTEGYPTYEPSLAKLEINTPENAVAIRGWDRSGIEIKNLLVDGNRDDLGYIKNECTCAQYNAEGACVRWVLTDDSAVECTLGALIQIGCYNGTASNQVVEAVVALEPRDWSVIHAKAGSALERVWGEWTGGCSEATITGNTIRSAGRPDGTWADGISLACHDSLVENNIITDATDGAIVIFGSPGSIITGNTITAVSRTLLGGIHLVPDGPYSYQDAGQWYTDYSGTIVENNTINADGAMIKIALPMGVYTWACPENVSYEGIVHTGAEVRNNTLAGSEMAYGYAIHGVDDWTVLGNTSIATHSGIPGERCGQTPDPPAAFQIDWSE